MSKNSCFIEYCEYVDDFRQEGKVKHLLKDILFIAVAATIGNADSWPQVEEFAEDHEEWLRNYLELPYGIPSHDTYERVFDRIDPVQFAKTVRSHWGIESTHWLLDVVLKEDAFRERKNDGPENKSSLNKVVLNKLKQYTGKKKMSNPTKRYKAANTKILEEIMFTKISEK